MPKRTEPPFFNRPEVASTVADIASGTRPLVIYMGSGVSVDDTGVSWFAMLTKLASHTSLDVEGLLRFAGDVSAPELATVVFNALEASHDDNARAELSKYLATVFYEKPAWRNGQFMDAIVHLCHQLVLRGREVAVLTTNYDMYLESHADELSARGEVSGVRFASYIYDEDVDSDDDAAEAELESGSDPADRGDAEILVVHLHGFVQEGAAQEDEEKLVFSERDYYRSEEYVFRIAETMFSSSDVLILGSALSDAPIVRALARTADKEELRRWAVVSRQGYSDSVQAYECVAAGDANDALSRLLDARGDQLNVRHVVTDFFSQAAQFPREVARAVRLQGLGRSYDADQSDYQRRVRAWYLAWMDGSSQDLREKFQAECHAELRKSEVWIRTALSNANAQIKIDFWVRDPEKSELVLWASSTGTWPDGRTARRVPIEAGSEYAAVKIFCAGSSQIIETGDHSDRWERYFGTPIRFGQGESSVTVAVITVAIKKQTTGKSVQLRDSRTRGTLIAELQLVGEKLVDERLRSVLGGRALWD